MQVRRIVNRVFSSNTFVLRDGGIAYLVDCGDVQEVSNLCEECVVKAVFLTHTHFDHIYGIDQDFQIVWYIPRDLECGRLRQVS